MNLDCLKCRYLQLMEMLNTNILRCGNIKVRHHKGRKYMSAPVILGGVRAPAPELLCLCFMSSQAGQKAG